jgi:hypothetical protein
MQMMYAPKKRLCARTSNMKIAKTKEKIPEEDKVRPRGWVEINLQNFSPLHSEGYILF